MTRSYRRKTNRGSWDPQQMLQAIAAVENKTLSVNKAAITFGIPRITLRRRIRKENKIANGALKVSSNAQNKIYRPI